MTFKKRFLVLCFLPIGLFTGYDVKKQAKRQQTGAVLFGLIGAAVASATRPDMEEMGINLDSGQSFSIQEGKN